MREELPRTFADNAARVLRAVEPKAMVSREQPVFLVDGDRTLTPDDTSRTFLSLAGLDPLIIKRRFQRDGYVFDAFRYHAEVHLDLGEAVFAALAPRVSATARLYSDASDFLRRAANRGPTYIVSAGIPRIWRAILDKLDLHQVGVIGGIDPANPYVFGRREKALCTELFLRYASVVVAVGDSDVDTEMLRLSHHAVVVANHRQNVDLLPGLADHPSLWQVVPRGEAHPGIPEIAFESIVDLADRNVPAPQQVRACP